MKKILVVLAAVALGGMAQASELWWTVSNDQVDGSSVEWTTARLCANSSEYTKNFGGTTVDTWTKDDVTGGGIAMSNIDGYSSALSFYVELVNSSDEVVGRSFISKNQPSAFDNQGSVTRAQLANNIASGGIMSTPPASAYSFGSFTTSEVIPEPTSGLLVMLGMMMLGLKRKRV